MSGEREADMPAPVPLFLVGRRWKVLLMDAPERAGSVLSFAVSSADAESALGRVRITAEAGGVWTLLFDAETGALREVRGPSGPSRDGPWPGLLDWPFGPTGGSREVSWRALDADRFEARIVAERNGKRTETVQSWRSGEPWWDESRSSEDGRAVLSASRIVPRHPDGAAPRQAVIDPLTGADGTGEFVAAWAAEYGKERDRLLGEARGKVDAGGGRREISATAVRRLAALQDRVRSAMKNGLPADLAVRFGRDREAAESLGVYTLEDAYRMERAMEGPVVIPPQVEGAFLESAREMERTGDIAGLLREFASCRQAASADPGTPTAGNPILGAPERYWEPSESAKRASELGDAVGRLMAGISSREALGAMLRGLLSLPSPPEEIAYDRFRFRHVDVVGSGRFVYPDPPEPRRIDFIRSIAACAKRLGIEEVPAERPAPGLYGRYLSDLLGRCR